MTRQLHLQRIMSCPDLPPELIMDILCRLPVKSLCRFRCVSKSWFSLINHPTFARLHLSKTQRQRLIMAAGSLSGLGLFSLDLENVSSNDDMVSVVELDFPASSSSTSNCDLKGVSFVSSCNGLVCFFNNVKDLLLYNPCTNECKRIPGKHSLHTELAGFGYAESIDDYKFVKIIDSGDFVEVYSLRKDSWKSIQHDLHFTGGLNEPGAPLNGAIHWLVSIEHQDVIASFDLIDEKFEISLLPDNLKGDDFIYSLGLLRDCLCLFVGEMDRNLLWVMKDYNDKASWTRIFIFEGSVYWLQPLSYLEDGKTMLFCGDYEQLIFYNSKDGKFKIIEVDGIGGDFYSANLYVESLVSPNCKLDFATEENLLGYLLE